eukprot:6612578-Alexandrium_andersonii.AAC.1
MSRTRPASCAKVPGSLELRSWQACWATTFTSALESQTKRASARRCPGVRNVALLHDIAGSAP